MTGWQWQNVIGVGGARENLARQGPVVITATDRCEAVGPRLNRRLRRITITLSGAENDHDVLKSALRYATVERAAMRVVLAEGGATGAFQDQLHFALLEVFKQLGARPETIVVITSDRSLAERCPEATSPDG
jgi:predicted ABC-type transport system involved in lysophospholipase L1 biosynthesis ATPase subunit